MAVRRWGVVALLTADYVACPFFEQQLEVNCNTPLHLKLYIDIALWDITN